MNSDYCIISQNNCSFNDRDPGIFLDGSKNSVIDNNSCINNYQNGIAIKDTSNCSVETNRCSRNSHNGLLLANALKTSVTNNHFSYNRGSGIALDESENVDIRENECSWNVWSGIRLGKSTNCTVMRNIISDNQDSGVRIFRSENHVLENNFIEKNVIGINLTEGSGNISVHLNDIFSNTHYGINADNNDGDNVDASHNWWGNSSGPYHSKKNSKGIGDNITDHVTFRPWLDDNGEMVGGEGDDKDDDNNFTIPIMASGFLGLCLFGFAFRREDLRFLLLSLLALPLYTRLEKDDILSQSARNDIYSYISSKPGANYSAIKQSLNFGTSSMVHHLNVLQREGYIRSKKEMGQRFFFPRDGQLHLPTKSPFPNLPPSPIQEKIIEYLKEKGLKTRKEIEEALSLKRQTVSYSIRNLERKGLVKTRGNGRNDLCEFVGNK